MAASCPSDTDNWMLAAVGLKYLKEGLEEFTDQNLKQQHQDFLNALPAQIGQCVQCTIDNVLPNHTKSSCKSKLCFCKDKKKRRLCPSGQCSQIFDSIVSSHRSGTPNWANTDLQQWYTNHVKIGTCFINTPGYKMKKSLSEIDCAGILSIIINNKFFDHALGGGGTAGSNDDFKKARDARNEIHHEPNLQLMWGKLQHYISLFIIILTGPGINQTPVVKAALEKLRQIQNGQYMLSKAEKAEIMKIEAKTEQAVAVVEKTLQTATQIIDTKTREAVAAEGQAVAVVEKTLQTATQIIDTKTREAVAAVGQAADAVQQAPQTSTQVVERSDGCISISRKKRSLKPDLIKYYRNELSTLSISPLFQRNDSSLLQFYRTPALYQIREKSSKSGDTSPLTYPMQNSKSRTEINSFKDIFFHGKRLNQCIYVTADAGYGKTSFSKKLLIDWCQAQNRIKSDMHFYQDSDVAIMKHFDYLFFVPLRNFRKEGYLDDMLHRQIVECVHHRYTKIFLQNILEKKKCLIILDGLDEWIPSESRCESEIPYWKSRKYCSVLITTRMWKFSTLYLQPKDVHIEMAGLKDTDSSWLVCRAIAFLNEKYGTDKSSELFCSQLVEHNLHDIMQCPLLLMLSLSQWYYNESIGKSHCEIYLNLIELLAKKYKSRLKTVGRDSVGSGNTEIELPDWFRKYINCCNQLKYLLALGKLSFFTLFGKDQTSALVFSEAVALMHISHDEIDFGVNIGLLTKEGTYEQSSSHCIISFIHKTYQEILASLYIASQLPTPDKTYKNIDEFCCSIENIISMSNFFKCLYRLRRELFGKIFQRLRQRVEGYNRNMYSFEIDSTLFSYQKMMLECLEEAYTSDKQSIQDIQLFDVFLYTNMCEKDLQILKQIDKKDVLSFYMIDENISSLKLLIQNDVLRTSVSLQQLVLKSSSLQRNINSLDTWCCQHLRSLCLDHFEISCLDLSTYVQLECLQLHAIEMLTYINIPPCVQYLNLQDLICIEHLDLSECKKLKWIYVKLHLSNLDLSACTNLHQLHLEGLKKLKQIDLSPCTQLQQLQMKGLHSIKQLDLSACTQLQQLHLENLWEIKELDLSACTILQELHLERLGEINQPDLSACTQLLQLSLKYNREIKQLDLSACTQLQLLHLEDLRELKQLDLSPCTQLQQLYLECLGKIKQIDLSPCTQLQRLHLKYIREIKKLDLSHCTQLRQFYLENLWEMNQLDLSHCTQLRQIHLENFWNIKQLDLSSCTQLQQLHLVDLSEMKQLNLSPCTQLQQLHVKYIREIKQLDLFVCTLLRQLHLLHLSEIQQLDLSPCTQLQQLYVERLGKITQLDISACTQLQQLHLKFIRKIKQLDLSAGTKLQQLHLEDISSIKQLDLSPCTQLQQLHLRGRLNIKQLDLSPCKQLQQLRLEEISSIKMLDLSPCKELQTLHLKDWKIKQLDLSAYTQLQQLHLVNLGEMKELHLSSCTQLQQLHLENLGEIKQLNLSACTQLQQLHVKYFREIKQLDLSACTQLQQLHLNYIWEIKELDLTACTKLKKLHMVALSEIEQLVLSACTQLQQIHLGNLWVLKQLDLSACTRLQQFHLVRLQDIEQLDLSTCTQLQKLHLERLLNIKQLDLSACTRLQQLHLARLRDIKQLDLSACTQLQQLHLEHLSEIKQLNWSACTQLQHLHLERLLKIKQLDLSACTQLQCLYLDSLQKINQVDLSACTQLYQLRFKDIDFMIVF